MALPGDVTGAELGRVLGIGARRVQVLGKESVFKKSRHGRWPLVANVKSYIAYKVKTEVERRKDEPADEEVKRERARKLRLENDARENLLVDTDEATAAIDLIFGLLKAELAGVPARLSQDVTERRRIEDALDSSLEGVSGRYEKAVQALREGRDPLETTEEDDA